MLRSNVTEQTPGRFTVLQTRQTESPVLKSLETWSPHKLNSYPLMWICFVKAQLTLATDLKKPYNIPDTK